MPPSRIEEARREALAVLERLTGSRVGVAAFAGDAVRLCPLTLDRGAVRLILESLSTSAVSEPGTDLGRGLRMAARMLPGGRRTEAGLESRGGQGGREGAARGPPPRRLQLRRCSRPVSGRSSRDSG